MWLQGELDELEREEFFRLKKVQGKKQRSAEVRRSPQTPCCCYPPAEMLGQDALLHPATHHCCLKSRSGRAGCAAAKQLQVAAVLRSCVR